MAQSNKTKVRDESDAVGTHLIDLADGWTSWRTLCVRGAGFPVNMLEQLAAPEAVAAIDTFIDRTAVYDEALDRAQVQCRRLLEESDGTTRQPLRRVRRQLSKGRSPDPLPDIPDMRSFLEALVRTSDEKNAARSAAERCVAEALPVISQALRNLGHDARLREAITWQNRKALHESVDVLLRTPVSTRNTQARRHEQLVVSYLQRYCAKNETIGFFGPLGWGGWVDGGSALTQQPGASLVTARRVHFEYWAIGALSETLSKNPQLRKWLRPRFDPRIRIGGGTLVAPQEVRHAIKPDAMRVLAACNGETAAIDIATAVVHDPDNGLQTEDQVYHLLEQAVRMGLVSWTLDVPVGPSPERKLREILERVGDTALRSQVMASLDKLESARDAVAAAAGDAVSLNGALGELESAFIQNTGKNPYQNPGQVYAGRSLVYEDCRRQTEVEIGPDIRKQVGPPLALVLQSARWFSHTIATRFKDYLNQLYPKLQAQFAPEPVPAAALEFLFDQRDPTVRDIVQNVGEELTARWASILSFEPGTRQIQLSTDCLRAAVSSAFAAPGPGWPGARHHSADILIAAEGPQDVRAGRCRCVLGEVHVTDTMVMRHLFQETHPHPEVLVDAYLRDVDQQQIFRVTTRKFRGHRKLWDPFLPRDLQLATDNSPPWRPKDQVLRIADLVIEDSANGLVVRIRDNARSFPAMVYFERLLWRESFTNFKLLASAPHMPRITVDDLVIKRESWRFRCRDLAFLYAKTETERFIGARCWARDQGLPHWVFARFPQEYKPVYVDLESPASVETMAKLARRAVEVMGENAALSLSEMLPNPNQSWLTDAAGQLYTSELRIVTVDPESWHPPGSAR